MTKRLFLLTILVLTPIAFAADTTDKNLREQQRRSSLADLSKTLQEAIYPTATGKMTQKKILTDAINTILGQKRLIQKLKKTMLEAGIDAHTIHDLEILASLERVEDRRLLKEKVKTKFKSKAQDLTSKKVVKGKRKAKVKASEATQEEEEDPFDILLKGTAKASSEKKQRFPRKPLEKKSKKVFVESPSERKSPYSNGRLSLGSPNKALPKKLSEFDCSLIV